LGMRQGRRSAERLGSSAGVRAWVPRRGAVPPQRLPYTFYPGLFASSRVPPTPHQHRVRHHCNTAPLRASWHASHLRLLVTNLAACAYILSGHSSQCYSLRFMKDGLLPRTADATPFVATFLPFSAVQQSLHWFRRTALLFRAAAASTHGSALFCYFPATACRLPPAAVLSFYYRGRCLLPAVLPPQRL